MRDGLVRVVVTLNFDLLVETALRELGVEPTVISTVDDVRGMEPLHMQRHLVWHLHGDYTNPEMLNTPDELREYDPVVDARLDELFDQYGLMVVGWSAEWDSALRAAVARCGSRRYPTTWLDFGDLKDKARRLAEQRDATVVRDSADAWFTRLSEACDAVRARSSDPLTTAGAVVALKRELGAVRPIEAHDRLAREVERLRSLPVLARTPAALAAMTYPDRLPILEAELELWASLIATAAYWGIPETDRWWTEQLDRFGQIPRLGGSTDAIKSLTAPAVVGLFAGGVAAAAAGRWDLVCGLVTGHPVRTPSFGVRAPLSAVIGAGHLYPTSRWPSRRLAGYLGPLLTEAVGLETAATVDAWERFEYIIWLANVRRQLANQPHALTAPVPYLRVDERERPEERDSAVGECLAG